jgi:hypothetical protein
MAFLNRCIFTATSSGTGSFVESGAATGFQTMENAGAVDQGLYSYAAQSRDLTQWEIGAGVWTASSKTLTRVVEGNSLGDTTTINFTAAPQVMITGLADEFRELLVSDRNYYIRSDGSNSNSGLVNSAGGAWLTVDFAMAALASRVDFGGWAVTLNIGAGTFVGTNIRSAFIGGGTLNIVGAGSASTTITSSASLAPFECDVAQLTLITLSSMTIVDPDGFGAINSNGAGTINVEADVVFGASAFAHISLGAPGGFVNINSAYSVTAAAPNHLAVYAAGCRLVVRAGCTLSGTQVYDVFCLITAPGEIKRTAGTYTGGTITGTRYAASLNGVINTSGGGANFFPGDVAGTTATGGQYA